MLSGIPVLWRLTHASRVWHAIARQLGDITETGVDVDGLGHISVSVDGRVYEYRARVLWREGDDANGRDQ